MYPEARMVLPMKIWKLPDGKENMFAEVCENGNTLLLKKLTDFGINMKKRRIMLIYLVDQLVK